MTKQRLLILGLVGLLVLNMILLGVVGFAGGRPSPPPPYRGPKKEIIQRLHFTPEQVIQYEQLIEAHQVDIHTLQVQSHSLKRQLYRTLQSDQSAQLDSLTQQIGALQTHIEQVHYHHFQDIKKLCTSEQIPLFDALTEDLARYFRPRRPFK